jgi:hypothetical protein
MIRNHDWMHALDIDHCVSTFDTDPFEPQPDAVGTIFPFWVPNTSPSHGFVELPYTLPQDSTLFMILQEQTIAIWTRKLDWVAEKGGMVLLNSHPDYMDFEGIGDGWSYPVGHYIDFLTYLKTRHAGMYYHALPAAIADVCRQRDQHPECAQCRSTSVAASRPSLPINKVSNRPPVPGRE